ncbi:10525_t:CDS:10 [Funneliformis geosporum]|nr:10525_t:CDS:10 [Funneliformis geosporum]
MKPKGEQPVASTSRAPKRKRKLIIASSSEEDNITILDMVQTRSARKKAKERRIISDSSEIEESVDESLDLSDEEISEDSDQMITDDSNESTIATRSKRRVNRINYSDEKYFRSRLGNDPDELKRRKESLTENKIDKGRFKILSSKLNNFNNVESLDRRNSVIVSIDNSNFFEENVDDEILKENDDPNDSSEEESFTENSNKNFEDDDYSESDQSNPMIDPISSTRANNSQFIAAHLDWCKKCGGSAKRYNSEKGPLVLCEYCSNSYHSTCYSKKTTNAKILCQQCSKSDSHISRCMVCHKEPSNKEKNSESDEDLQRPIKDVAISLDPEDSQVFFRCLRCSQAIHESCLPFLNEEESLSEKMQSYRESWNCHLCLKWEDKIDKILTFRKISVNSNKEGSMEVSRSQIEEINADSDNIEDYEFLVKFEDVSYLQVEWVPGPWVFGISPTKYNNYVKSQPDPLTKEEAIKSYWTKIHRILDVQFKNEVTLREQLENRHKNLGKGVPVQAYVKWRGLNYADATWEPIKNLDKKKFEKAYQIRKNSYAIKKPDIFVNRTFIPHKVQPSYLKNKKHYNTLKDYQLDGVNWLLHNWCNEISCILADEMGLERNCYPFLIVAPKSTTAGWSREFKRWAKELNVIEYHGDGESLKVVEDLEMFPDGTNLKCHVVITTPEAIMQHTNTFLKVPLWEVLVVDEAHSLKRGQESLLFKALNTKLNVYHKVLLTGTPMMNCIDELFNLLKFLGHKEFENPKELAEEYQGLPSADQLPALHKLLKSYFLRRTKSQVNLGLPPMDDIIVRVSMTPIQKTIYKETLEKNADFLKRVARTNRSTGFTNILMSLRQIVCHPYIINREEIDPDDERTKEQEENRKKKLVETSGKLILLRDMLIKLHGKGHRVLIFSQFVSMLSILEEFLEDLGYKYVKLDGSTDNEIRQHNINAFQASDSDIFVFLLSTRAGGVGLNLMAADTVFIYDPDFNPHQDIQAMSRVHRIGQFKPVKVFRFITQFSIEEKIVEKGKIKLAKNELVVEKMDNEVLDVKEVDDIIRYSAKALFSEDNNEKPVGPYTDEAIEKLLDRSQMKAAEQVTESKNLTGFAFARIWDTVSQEVVEERIIANVDGEESVESRDFWTKLLAHVATTASAEEPLQGRGARKRNRVDYYEGDISTSRKRMGKKRSIDPDFIPVEKEDIVSSETDTENEVEDPSVLDISGRKPTSFKGLLTGRKNDDGQKPKKSRQSRPNDDMNNITTMVTGSGFHDINNITTIPPDHHIVTGPTSNTPEMYNYSTPMPYYQYQWCYYQNINYAYNMTVFNSKVASTIEVDHNLPQRENQLVNVITIDSPTTPPNTSVQPNVEKDNNPVHPVMSKQSEHPNLQLTVPQHQTLLQQAPYQAKTPNMKSKSVNSNSRGVIIRELNVEALKVKIDKASSSKTNNNDDKQSNLQNQQEPIVIISDDDLEPQDYHMIRQNGERKVLEANNIVSTPVSSNPANVKTPKNKGKQIVLNKNNSDRGYEDIEEFVRLFDEIQRSDEDFGLRQIAITRLYHKLTSLGFNIEGHITSLAARGKLDHELLRSFRNS